ncbi:hypothetical protein [Mycobacteroides abscessus]|uniref:hypothetical protein n=1 Tax=Mycobacteroides abscessus TaxID=36809 RepID=UPI00092BE51A|nr:hypothetical protein [Mycobacteroides abscessus]QCO29015.1 hypothetical protein CFE69_24035 [Mycobacteroides abscessus subsp. massiliense]SHY29631.1 Uncharacterised protein [Mycobacteroides abscessus subsp. abscessus]SID70712.1 Uncharacterised protein [Mycobacteroides abscessus subsp. abscessus]SII85254.1 Uncharacterised protein [Mycobacteroides abscessus subsp. abscessus]SIJ05545.1 Uncharacterised protein [Mycobacteroides abscessus subsp. abscessus]
MIDPVTPTKVWQSMVPALGCLDEAGDTAERLLLLLHYAIDWDTSWVADHRKTYWDEQFPSRVRRAAYRSHTLESWWSQASVRLGATTPRQHDRRTELAVLLRTPALPVIGAMQRELPALVMRVRIIADAVAQQRKDQKQS